MKHTVKKDSKDINKCSEPCPFLNDGKSKIQSFFSDVKIGSGFCQSECKHHKNNNKIEKNGKDYNVFTGGIVWIECDKLDRYFLD